MVPYFFLFQSVAFCQTQSVVQVPPSHDNQQSMRVISDVPDLPSEVLSIEKEASITHVKYKNGETEKFDLSKEADLRNFINLFSRKRSNNEHLVAPDQFIELPSTNQGIHVITSENGKVDIDVIPEVIVKDKEQLKKKMKGYGISVQ